jgi:tight adherence protein B
VTIALLLRWTGAALATGGVLALVAMSLGDPAGGLHRAWTSHVASLDRHARFLRLGTSGERIAVGQLVAIAISLLAAAALAEPLLLALAPMAALGPSLVLRRRHEARVTKLEEQLDGWLVILASALRAAPSLGDAIATSQTLVAAPLAEELDVMVKRMRLGTPVDRAVLDLGAGIASRTFSGGLAALLVARQTGGELSAILEETAASIREMTRLEGVLRAKTAEGRSQAYVLGAIPFFLMAAIHYVDPRWLDPLGQTTLGAIITLTSTALWLGAILIARRILAVDL